MFSEQNKKMILDVARKSIAHGLEQGKPLKINSGDFDEVLREQRATFVTLKLQGELKGCIGVLEAHRALIEDVAENAYAAAFRDSRFSPLTPAELDQLDVSVSILEPAQPMRFTSEEDLINQIQPGIDGLILEEGWHRGTFLPAVWESVKTVSEFLNHLKVKAGLPMDYWSETIKIKRYTTEMVE